MQNTVWRKYRLFALIFIGLLVTSLLRSASVLHYSTWSVDEQSVVCIAVGFLDFDFNPRWFLYHTLPMYLLSIVYFALYWIYQLGGLISSKIEFASLLFANDEVFFVPARLLFSFAHTLGCFVLAYIIRRKYESTLGAVLFFLTVILLPDSVMAATKVRVDTLVFLFMALTVYFSCYAERRFGTFVLSIIFCSAAFASKITTIVLAPVLFLKTVFEVYRGNFPKRYLLCFLVLSPLTAIALMPYSVLDFERYRSALSGVLGRASGSLFHIGKRHRTGFLEKILAPWVLLVRESGFLTVGASLSLVPYAAFNDAALFFALIYAVAYTLAFSTSAFVDTYWLRPVYAFVMFFAFVAVVKLFSSKRLARWLQVRFGATDRFRLRASSAALLALTVGVFIVQCHEGIRYYHESLTTKGRDTRIVASEWIHQNLPEGSTIFLDGYIKHYLPRVFSADRSATLKSFYYRKVDENALLSKAFDRYYNESRTKRRAFDVRFTDYLSQKYEPDQHIFSKGSYVVLSSAWYNRYYLKHVKEETPALAAKAQAYYKFICLQDLIKSFSGRGPEISVYRVIGGTIPAQ